MAHIPLGPFELEERIGQGGMSEVWRGKHAGQQVPVAVKVMTMVQARQQDFRAAFRNEVRAVAALDHPGIVVVFDYGEVSDQTEEASGGSLAAGSPYLVMEYLPGGSLLELRKRLPWPELLRVLMSLLDALAHAHARGVIHRDLKPGNVLCGSATSSTPAGLKLTDFGVAHAMGAQVRTGTTEDVYGTPAYMAPEQFWGHWRDYGPWTDLYALGCMTWRLATGRLPFQVGSLVKMARAHLQEPPPTFHPRSPVPAGFEGWLRRLMQKDPDRRFRRAADAAWGLLALGEPEDDDVLPRIMTDEIELVAETTTLVLRREDVIGDDAEAAPWLVEDTGPPLVARALPSMPRQWARRVEAAPMTLVGAGLGLYGMRTIPLVGRERERDAIWAALREVRETGTARVVLLQGPAGCGKSAICEWMSQRADEVGAASTLKAIHGPMTGAAEGLPRMVARAMQCVGLSRTEVYARLDDRLRKQGVVDEYEAHALTELIHPAGPEETRSTGRVVRFNSPTERHVLVRRLLERLAHEAGGVRPVILWLEDVHWGADALGFVEHLLRAQRLDPTPVLVLMTARVESLVERPLESQLLDTVLEWPDVRTLNVGPLPPDDRAALVRELLHLQGDLADLVEARTGGNPLFAVELVGDWITRGLLRATASGFALEPGVEAALPDSLHQVWRDRILRLLGTGDEVLGLQALEIAATMGQEVDSTEWRAVCEAAGVEVPDELVERLKSARLVRPTEAGFSFVQGMVRESLERSAREAGRWREHNRACAAMLAVPGADLARLGGHLLAAGELESALTPLVEGARERLETCDYQAVLALLSQRDTAMRRLGLAASDPRWAASEVLRAHAYLEVGEMARADKCARRAEGRSRRHGNDALLGQALLARAHIKRTAGLLLDATAQYRDALEVFSRLRDRRGATQARAGLAEVARAGGEMARAESLFEQVVQDFESMDVPLDLAEALASLGGALRQRGNLDRAQVCYQRARPLYEAIGHQRGVASCLMGEGTLAELRGQLDAAGEAYRRALEINEGIGSRSGRGTCMNLLAELARCRGDLISAERGYRRSLQLHEEIGDADSFIPAANLGLVLLAQGRWDEARAVLGEAGREVEEQGRLGWVGAIHAMVLPCVVGDAARWAEHLGKARGLLGLTEFADPDVVWALRLAGDVALDHGQVDQARQAWELAREQCLLLGNLVEEAELGQAIERLRDR